MCGCRCCAGGNDEFEITNKEAAPLYMTITNGVVTSVNDIYRLFSRVKSLKSDGIARGRVWRVIMWYMEMR